MRRTAFIPSVSLAFLLVVAAARLPARLPQETDPGRLVFLLEYIGTDYGATVHDGKIVNAFEYEEMTSLSATLVDNADVLVRHGAGEGVRTELVRLQQLIRELRPPVEVRSLASGLASRLLGELEVVAAPTATPDLRRGEVLYAANCAPCHGASGAGDGFADPDMTPPATSFRGARMRAVSTNQVYGAMAFGIEGTAMPSYVDALPQQEQWDIAFYVLTLREDFDPGPFKPDLPVTLEDLVIHSSDDLLSRLREQGVRADIADIDYLRQYPPEFGLPRGTVASTRPGTGGPVPDESASLSVALRLQDAFSAVADRVLPSVVNVTSYVRDEHADSGTTAGAESWRVAAGETALYPGFRRLKSGSGFFVSEDGYLLTCLTALTREDGELVEVIDVELPNGRHVLSRLVGAEPTINLAVLKLEVVSEIRPPTVTPVAVGDSEAVRVGHWAIAIGDPWGPERTYAVGTLAAQPQRQCYQEQLSGTLMQASLAIHPESYGGPLVDIRGNVVGMTVPPPGGDTLVPRTSEFALPINLALNIYRALKTTESRRSPWLGFSVLELAAAHRRFDATTSRPKLPRTGVYLDDVFDPSPASRAGIRVGDSLVSVDGNRLFSVLDFQKWLYLSGIGRTVRLEIFRDGETLFKDVTIEERPRSATTR